MSELRLQQMEHAFLHWPHLPGRPEISCSLPTYSDDGVVLCIDINGHNNEWREGMWFSLSLSDSAMALLAASESPHQRRESP